MIPPKVTLTNLGKGVGACRFTSKPRQQLLTEASTGVGHTTASTGDADQFGANGSCSVRGFHWERGRRICGAFSARRKKLKPARNCSYCACTCGKRPKHFIEDMNFEIRQRCGTCPPSKQNKTKFTCQLPTMGSTCLHWSLSSLRQRLLTTLEY